jgi:hypothetical protein
MSEEDSLTEEIRNRIWHSKPDLPASLLFLVLLNEKAKLRTPETITDFGKKIREPDFFSVDDLKKTNQNLVLYKEEGVLKPKAFDWMEKYTINLETALSVASFAMATTVHLRNQLALENFHKQNRNRGGYKTSFAQLFNGSTPYADALELIMDTLDVYNQGINAKTIHKKKLKSRNTVCQLNVKTEKDKECVDPMNKGLVTKKNGDNKFSQTDPGKLTTIGTDSQAGKRIGDESLSKTKTVKKIKVKKAISLIQSQIDCDSTLPRYVLIPLAPLNHDITVDQPTENLLFSTHPVLDDGNCLYHALLNSKVFRKLYPRFGQDTNKLRKELSECLISPSNITFSQKLFAHCPAPRVKDRKNAKMGIVEWSTWLMKDKEWGSQSECILFTKRFGINIVIVQQTQDGIPTFGTFYRHRKWFELDDPWLTGKLYNMKLHVDQTIFVWLHRLDHPKQVLQSQVEANHFSILELCHDDGVADRSELFIFKDFLREKDSQVNPIILSIPDSLVPSESEGAPDQEIDIEKQAMGDIEPDSCGGDSFGDTTVKIKSGKQQTMSAPCFHLVPNGIHMEYSLPPTHFCEEFMVILKELPDMIESNLSHDELYEILQKEEKMNNNIQDLSLVYIDSCKFEFFLSNDSGSIRLFDELIMTPYLTQWSDRDFTDIKTTNDFYQKLLSYIDIYFPGRDIHAVSFLLHFPGASAERQWSHVDGTREIWQGSIMCGEGHASTLEFSVLEPRVSNTESLRKVWPTQHNDCDVFSKIEAHSTCQDLITTIVIISNAIHFSVRKFFVLKVTLAGRIHSGPWKGKQGIGVRVVREVKVEIFLPH